MKTITTKSVVNFKLLSLLFAFSTIMRLAATSVERDHPLLGWLLVMLETISWIIILIIGVMGFVKSIRYGGPMLWKKVRTYVRRKKAKNNDTFVPVEQLKGLRVAIQRLGLALHGTTPEREHERRVSFQMRGEAVPPLVLPPQNSILYAEFESLVKMLNHFGFPRLERVRLRQQDFAFAQKWQSDLEARLHLSQKVISDQRRDMLTALSLTIQAHKSILDTYPEADNDPGYQRLRGALRLLRKMAENSHCPPEFIAGYLPALQQDLAVLNEQLKQAAV